MIRGDSPSRFACVSRARLAQRVGLRLAPALRHRLGEVGEQHREPEPERELEREPDVAARPVATSRTSTSVVNTLPTSTTNITGFRTMWRGSSLTNASRDRAPHDRRIEERALAGSAI